MPRYQLSDESLDESSVRRRKPSTRSQTQSRDADTTSSLPTLNTEARSVRGDDPVSRSAPALNSPQKDSPVHSYSLRSMIIHPTAPQPTPRTSQPSGSHPPRLLEPSSHTAHDIQSTTDDIQPGTSRSPHPESPQPSTSRQQEIVLRLPEPPSPSNSSSRAPSPNVHLNFPPPAVVRDLGDDDDGNDDDDEENDEDFAERDEFADWAFRRFLSNAVYWSLAILSFLFFCKVVHDYNESRRPIPIEGEMNTTGIHKINLVPITQKTQLNIDFLGIRLGRRH